MNNIETCKFVKVICCGDCGRELNRTIKMTGVELWDHWAELTFSGSMNSGRCGEGCRSTFHDLNLNTRSRIIDVATGIPVEYQVLKWLRGKFYSEDEQQICSCYHRNDADLYQSSRYGVMHTCGKWLPPGPQRFDPASMEVTQCG